MLTTEKIKKYREGRKLTVLINFKIIRKERDDFKEIAKKRGVSMSELIRMLIYECIEDDKNRN